MGNIFPQVISLKARPSFFAPTVKLIEKSFQYPSHQSLIVDFAPLLDKSNHHNCFILIDENENVIAHVGAKERIIKISDKEFNICMLGGIAVDEKYRSQGHFHHLFQDVLAEKISDTTFFMLWSDQEKLYSKYGFSLCGGQYELSEQRSQNNFTKTRFNALSVKQQQEIKSLFENSFQMIYQTPHRNDCDWELISKISSSDLYIDIRDGKIINYFFINKGQDLEGIIYEYGSSEEITQLIESARSVGKVWMGAPLIESDQEHYQFLMAPGEPNLFKEFIHAYTSGIISLRSANALKQEIFFDFNDETLVLSSQEFLRGIFGPAPFEELGNIKPFFLSGLDSI